MTKKILVVLCCVLAVYGFWIWWGLLSDSTPNANSPTTAAVSAMDALSQMEIAFEGSHSKSQIKEKLDKAMGLYDVPINEENYSRCGSTLVELRKGTGIEEMAILDYMIRSKVPGVKMGFPEAAAISASFLKAGDK